MIRFFCWLWLTPFAGAIAGLRRGSVPLNITTEQLTVLVNSLLNNVRARVADAALPCSGR